VKEVIRKNGESKLEKQHIDKIVSAFFGKKDIENFCKVVSKQTVLDNNSNMTISLYAMPRIERDEILPVEEAIEGWLNSCEESNMSISYLINMI